MSDLGSRFISEKDVEARKKTQESEGVTEAPYDARSLYERLQVEKERKQEEYEAFSAFKNRVHRLDEEEVEYLKTVAVNQHRVEMQNEEEVAELLREAKTARPAPVLPSGANQEQPPVRRPTASGSGGGSRNTQRSLLSNALKRPSPPRTEPGMSCSAAKKPNLASDATERQVASPTTRQAGESSGGAGTCGASVPAAATATGPAATAAVSYLPGLADYSRSDSDKSSDDSDDNSESTDVEDAACTLADIASTRARKQKACSAENG